MLSSGLYISLISVSTFLLPGFLSLLGVWLLNLLGLISFDNSKAAWLWFSLESDIGVFFDSVLSSDRFWPVG